MHNGDDVFPVFPLVRGGIPGLAFLILPNGILIGQKTHGKHMESALLFFFCMDSTCLSYAIISLAKHVKLMQIDRKL